MSSVSPFTRNLPCPVCGGERSLPQGKGVRCYGFLSSDGYAHCTREEYSGQLAPHKNGTTYAHRLEGSCRCGIAHGGPVPEVARQSAQAAVQRAPIPWSVPDTHVEMIHRYELKGRLEFEVCRIWKHHRSRHRGAATLPRHRGADGLLYWGIPKEWKSNPKRPLYRQEAALEALRAGRCLFIVEGERDVDAMVGLGFDATCSPFGAGKCTAPQAHRIRRAMRSNPEASVRIIADDDDPGIKHALKFYELLTPTADLRARVTAERPPNDYHDMADAIAADAEALDGWK